MTIAHIDPAEHGQIVRLRFILSEMTIKDGFQAGQDIHLAGHMAVKVEGGKLVRYSRAAKGQ
jgi:hypothetical protein